MKFPATPLYKALLDAGASEERAERPLRTCPPGGELATKTDIVRLGTRLDETATKAEMAAPETRLLRWNVILASIIIAAVGLVVKL